MESLSSASSLQTYEELPQLNYQTQIEISKKSKRQKENFLYKTQPFIYTIILKQCYESLKILELITPNTSKNFNNLKSSDLNKTKSYNNITKFNSDRLLIQELILEGVKDLSINNNIVKFTNLVKNYVTKSDEGKKILLNNISIKNKLGMLSVEVDTEKMRSKKDVEILSDELGRLKDLYEDTLNENKIKSHYVNKWEEARKYQHRIELKQKEREIIINLKTTQQKYKEENYVHDQIASFQTYKQAEYWKEINNWSEKYDNDLSELLLKIKQVSRNRDIVKDRFECLLEKYKFRQEQIESYLILREKRREEAKINQERNEAATKIQAWWRGVMVRRCLGPYRKKKGKKCGKNNGDKKKK